MGKTTGSSSNACCASGKGDPASNVDQRNDAGPRPAAGVQDDELATGSRGLSTLTADHSSPRCRSSALTFRKNSSSAALVRVTDNHHRYKQNLRQGVEFMEEDWKLIRHSQRRRMNYVIHQAAIPWCSAGDAPRIITTSTLRCRC
jgi:hypothetical protein